MPQHRSAAALAAICLAIAACSSGAGSPAPATSSAPRDPAPSVALPTVDAPSVAVPTQGGTIEPPEPTEPSDGNGTTSVLPCEALAADVSAALGSERTVGDTVLEAEGCTYNLSEPGPDSVPGLGGIVNVRLEEEGNTDMTILKSIWPEGAEDLTGIGDAAFWAPEVDVLYAVKNGNIYAVQLVIMGEAIADPKAVTTSIMRALFAKI
jgi:hypothetical protein